MGSRSSSELRARLVRRGIGSILLLVIVSALAPGCVMVRPEQRELLADPAMTFGADGTAAAQEEHVLSNREGAYGGSATTGGGCGCN